MGIDPDWVSVFISQVFTLMPTGNYKFGQQCRSHATLRAPRRQTGFYHGCWRLRVRIANTAAQHRWVWEPWSVSSGNKAEINCGKSQWRRFEGLGSKYLSKIRTIVSELNCPPKIYGLTGGGQAIYIQRMLLFPSHGDKRVLNNSLTEMKR